MMTMTTMLDAVLSSLIVPPSPSAPGGHPICYEDRTGTNQLAQVCFGLVHQCLPVPLPLSLSSIPGEAFFFNGRVCAYLTCSET